MCGRYTLHHTTDQITMRFEVQEVAAAPAERFNIAPTQPVAVITQQADGRRLLDAFQWGLIPSWAKEPGIGNKLINARAETLAEKPSFKNALKRRRCLIPADGFYEWKKEGTARQPMHIRRNDGDLFAFAGLWEEWKQEDGTPLRTCTIITVGPNELMRSIHDRMPALLEPEAEAAWLDLSRQDPSSLLDLLKPYPAEAMEAYAVSKRVNAPVIDDPSLLNSL
jgi:putative SOS response-associated peptidase YedK